jgi:hypothetical protein
MQHTKRWLVTSIVAACGGGPQGATTPAKADTQLVAADQLPPTGAAELEAWLATGKYKAWTCEPSVHAARQPSPHGFNRICSNTAITDNAGGTAPWPVGAAAVKEMYQSATATQPMGYAVYLKAAESADGAGWYWYERIEADQIADGRGDSGPAKRICAGCHKAAGTDTAHTPSMGARDQVYTPVVR